MDMVEIFDKWQRVKQKEAEINHSGSVSSGNSTVISTESELLENDLLLSPEEIAQCYIQAFAEMDTKLTEHEEAANAGTTAVTCLIRKYHGKTFYHVANVGDSRAILFLNGKTIRLSVDHKATTNKDEVKRIRDANGIVFNNRVGGFISVTRALGQADEKDFIISDPHIASGEVKKSEDAFLLLVSDGITDVFSDEESTEFVTQRFARGYKSITICKDLLDEAKAKGARDNMTVVLACLASQ
jgi:serine/threonine protein phosphatase PrpC